MPASPADSQAREGYEMRSRVSCIMVGSTHNARNSAAHGVSLTRQILLHYGRNGNARESVHWGCVAVGGNLGSAVEAFPADRSGILSGLPQDKKWPVSTMAWHGTTTPVLLV